MNVCFIGTCGHWWQAYGYLKTRQDVSICGFAPGSEQERLSEQITQTFPIFSDYRQMLKEVKPDLAVVSPIFGYTAQVIIECAKAHIDVFAEKPIAASCEELALVRRAVEESGIRLGAMHYLRYEPAFYHAAQMVHEGKIGKVQMLTGQKSYIYGTRPDWYGNPKLYCGTIPWVGIHAIDWIGYFSRKRFVSVTAQSMGENPEMAAVCQFCLEDGVIASVNIDFYRPKTAPTHGDDRVRCVGTEGVIEVSGGKISLINQEGSFEFRPETGPNLLQGFLDGENPIPAEELFHITQAALAAKESAITHRTVFIGG